GGGKGGTFRVTPDARGRNLNVYVPDFGGLLREAGWLDGLAGGFLDLRGHYNDAAPQAPLAGKVKLGPYRLQKVMPRPDVGTLNSTIDGLNRAGNALQQFDSLDASITRIGDRIELRDGRTSGNSIGLTTAGVIDLAASTAHLRGVVVPGFALNNLLSNVPLLGPLLTGGKDGGVFAIAYRLDGPLADLKTDVNMMATMTPGALRELLTGSAGNGAPMFSGPASR
ncbi:MAG TPA: AsmA-like C-terminal region-containing protein, partial [Reyranella sp.]|nr:AsmA-like C-terminal region-containing protein [Reyranella sp.]